MNKQKKLSIGLVTYNAEKYLYSCLISLMNQSFKDWEILIIDNGSTDGTIRYIKENYPQFKIVEHKNNLGFAQAHNQIISWTRSEYIMCMNQDIVLDKDYIKNIVKFLDNNKKVGSVTGKLYKWEFEENKKTKTIDSIGLELYKNYRVVDRQEGVEDIGQFNSNEEVFGISGAIPVYRRKALDKVKIINNSGREEFFDEDFFAYKEDVDLAFRLRLADISSYYVANAIAWHDRSTANSHLQTNWKIASAHRKKNRMVNYLSYRNHLLMLYKNSFRINIFKNFHHIAWYELRKYIFMKIFNRVNNKQIKSFCKLRPLMKNKRKQIKELTKIQAQDMLKWIK
ncbi:glycosyltransferase family 2 protein [Patescibacteria group bacterium]|nr:glycosyltransferase family 2 protein [Patescibacteria group bacterium]